MHREAHTPRTVCMHTNPPLTHAHTTHHPPIHIHTYIYIHFLQTHRTEHAYTFLTETQAAIYTCAFLSLFGVEPVCPLLTQRSRDRLGLPGLGQINPGLGARRGGVCLAAQAEGCGVGVGPGGEGVQVEDGVGPAVDGQHDDKHTDDIEQESRPGLVCGEPV